MKRLTMALLALALATAVACEKPAPPADPGTAKQAAPAEKIVEAEIPDDLKAQAASEITAENAEKMAAQLEAEIDAELE